MSRTKLSWAEADFLIRKIKDEHPINGVPDDVVDLVEEFERARAAADLAFEALAFMTEEVPGPSTESDVHCCDKGEVYQDDSGVWRCVRCKSGQGFVTEQQKLDAQSRHRQ